MIFGTQVGVAPGSLAMQLGTNQLCPPDPVWNYFPSPFEPYTYAAPPTEQMAPAAAPCVPVCVTPPNMPPPRDPPVITIGPSPPSDRPPPAQQGPTNFQYINPYADGVRLSGLAGLGEVGPFGMTWAGFLGVMAVALGGGIGLGYLSKRRRG